MTTKQEKLNRTVQELIESVVPRLEPEITFEEIKEGESLHTQQLKKKMNVEAHNNRLGLLIKVVQNYIAQALAEQRDRIKNMPAFENLVKHQGQLDEDGICVAVSRQALEEVITSITKETL